MILTSLEIENFYSYKKAKLDFNYSIPVLIIGEKDSPGVDSNGAGKSSLFEAVSWAAFGVTTTGIGGDDIVNRAVGKNCIVTLKGTTNGQEFEIIRARKHSTRKNELKFIIDGKDCSGKSNTDTQAKIEQILNISLDFYKHTTFFNPRNIQPFCSLTDSKQKSLLESLLDLSKLDRIKETLLENQKNIANYKIQQEKELAALRAKQETSINRIHDNVVAYKNLLKGSLGDLQKQTDEYRKELGLIVGVRVDEVTYNGLLKYKKDLVEKDYKNAKILASVKSKKCQLCGSDIVNGNLSKLDLEKLEQEQKLIKDKLSSINSYVTKHQENVKLIERAKFLRSVISKNDKYITDYSEIKENTKASHQFEKYTYSLNNRAIGEIKDRIKVADKESAIIDGALKLFGSRGVKGYVVSTLLAPINKALKTYTNALCPELSVSLEYNSEKNTLKVVLPGRTYESCSSGEAKRIDICVLFAFLEIMSTMNVNSNFVVLDEVFDALDESGLEKLIELLYTVKIPNLFVITHNNSLKSYFNEVIVIKNENNESKICSP